MKELLSPKQVATSIGVSESSLKRWCDQGVITTERTPGGHRRIRIGEVIRFLREQQHPLVRPEVLGLPVGAGQGPRSLAKAQETLLAALEAGDSEQSRRIVLDLFLSGTSVVSLCEDLLAGAMHAIGDGWECGKLEIFQERQACEVLNRILYDLRSVLPPAEPSSPVAIGGAPAGDHYRLATLMVELVLVDAGWNAMSLGTSLPFGTMSAAARHHNPALFWLSFSHVGDLEATRIAFLDFLKATPDQMKVVIGGQQATRHFSSLADGNRVFSCHGLDNLRSVVAELRPAPGGAID